MSRVMLDVVKPRVPSAVERKRFVKGLIQTTQFPRIP
jgi:hypothetical protein